MKRIMTILIVLVLSIMMSATAFGLNATQTDIEADLAAQFSTTIGKEVPADMKILIGNERIQGYIVYANTSNTTLTIVIEDGVITQMNFGEINDSSLVAILDAEIYAQIRNDENTVNGLITAYKNGELTLDANGFVSGIKLGVMKIAANIFSWFI